MSDQERREHDVRQQAAVIVTFQHGRPGTWGGTYWEANAYYAHGPERGLIVCQANGPAVYATGVDEIDTIAQVVGELIPLGYETIHVYSMAAFGPIKILNLGEDIYHPGPDRFRSLVDGRQWPKIKHPPAAAAGGNAAGDADSPG